MEEITQGSAEKIVLTAFDQNDQINKTDLATFTADALFISGNDPTKYIHVRNSAITKNVALGTLTIPITKEQSMLITGRANFELRDSTGQRIPVTEDAFYFVPTKISTLTP